MGAAAASVLAETMITGLYFRLCREYITPGMVVRCGWKRLPAVLIMLAAVLVFTLIGSWAASWCPTPPWAASPCS